MLHVVEVLMIASMLFMFRFQSKALSRTTEEYRRSRFRGGAWSARREDFTDAGWRYWNRALLCAGLTVVLMFLWWWLLPA